MLLILRFSKQQRQMPPNTFVEDAEIAEGESFFKLRFGVFVYKERVVNLSERRGCFRFSQRCCESLFCQAKPDRTRASSEAGPTEPSSKLFGQIHRELFHQKLTVIDLLFSPHLRFNDAPSDLPIGRTSLRR